MLRNDITPTHKAAASAMQEPIESGPVVLLDVDNTIINGQSELNHKLIKELKRWGLRIILYTSYDLHYRLLPCVNINATRWDVIRRLRSCGLKIDAALVSASPYYETTETFGQYYSNTIAPIEQSAREYLLTKPVSTLPELLQAIGKDSKDVQAELAVIQKGIAQPYGEIPVWQEDGYKNGKQHLLAHAIKHYKRLGCKRFIVLDDKIEVIQVAQRAMKEQVYGADIYINTLQVRFNHLEADDASIYTNFFQSLGLTPKPTASPSSSPCLYLHDIATLTTTGAYPAAKWLNDYAVIHAVVPNNDAKAQCEAHVATLSGLTSRWIWHVIPSNSSALSFLCERAKVREQLLELAEIEEAYLALPDETTLTLWLQEDPQDNRLKHWVEGYRLLHELLKLIEPLESTSEKPSAGWSFPLFKKSRASEVNLKLLAENLKAPYALINRLLYLYLLLEHSKSKLPKQLGKKTTVDPLKAKLTRQLNEWLTQNNITTPEIWLKEQLKAWEAALTLAEGAKDLLSQNLQLLAKQRSPRV